MYQDKPLKLEDSSFVYFAGLMSLTFPITFYALWPNFLVFAYLAINASALSVIDLYAWWTLKMDAE